MFQIAAALGYSFDYGHPFVMPYSTLNPSVWKHYFPPKEAPLNPFQFESWLKVKERSHTYTMIQCFAEPIILDGYFQSWKYFDRYRGLIVKYFGFDNLTTASGTCSIHVRRGDYLLYPTKHPVVTGDYLVNALAAIVNLTMARKFIVFSDDISWCKNWFKGIEVHGPTSNFNLSSFEFSENRDEMEDLKLMASCEHQIISNSTFSWWGAYLNPNPRKIVVTPHEDNWFGIDNKHLNTQDLIPQDWQQIKF